MAKNTHLTHLEDRFITDGISGAQESIQILREMGEFLSGKGGNVNVTTKWDGAPAIVCGIDPTDNKFFVGTKSVFAKNEPKVCKTPQDIQKWYSGELAQKLKTSLQYLPSCNIKGVLQGDLMFTNDKRTETIDGKRYITFRPNTITYAVNPKTPLGREINIAQMGIVFHTSYSGPSLPEMSASFDIPNGAFKESPSVWAESATFQDIGGVASMSMAERNSYDGWVNKAEGSVRKAGSIMNKIQSGKKALKLDTELLKFFNNYVKRGQNIPSVEKAYVDFHQHLANEYNKVMGKLKTNAAQDRKGMAFLEQIVFMEDNEKDFKMMIAAYMNIQKAKNLLVEKMKAVQSMNMFVDRGGTYEATTPEGFVAITGKKATKLIDRLEFSRLNFTVPKVW